MPEKIAGVVKGIQSFVQTAIDSVIGFLVGKAKALLGALGLGPKAAAEAPAEEAPVEETGPLTPDQARAQIIQELTKPSTAEDAAGAIAEAKAQAVELKGRFQPRLENSTIEITVVDTAPDAVTEDHAVDIRVALSPAQTVEKPVAIQVPDEITPPVIVEFTVPSELPVNPTKAEELAGFTRTEFLGQLAGQQSGINALMAGK